MAQPAGNEQAPQAGTSLWGVLRQVLFFLMIYSMFFGNPLNKLMGGPSSPQAGSGSTVQQSGGPAHVNLMPLNYEMVRHLDFVPQDRAVVSESYTARFEDMLRMQFLSVPHLNKLLWFCCLLPCHTGFFSFPRLY
jgi:hypothetical protein